MSDQNRAALRPTMLNAGCLFCRQSKTGPGVMAWALDHATRTGHDVMLDMAFIAVAKAYVSPEVRALAQRHGLQGRD